MKTLSINRKKGKATNPNNSFFSEKKKSAARVGFEPTTHVYVDVLHTRAYFSVHAWLEEIRVLSE